MRDFHAECVKFFPLTMRSGILQLKSQENHAGTNHAAFVADPSWHWFTSIDGMTGDEKIERLPKAISGSAGRAATGVSKLGNFFWQFVKASLNLFP